MTESNKVPEIEIVEGFRELRDQELDCVFGGADSSRVRHSEFRIVKLVDAATP